ncbi:unnamed protein product [Lasius platythorax]|uniref:PRELI/MSF1 domain-containing protein n=1 Tax=Lasius platythorax TaxID=488582 RepID=A0AAV2PBA4_9HYME
MKESTETTILPYSWIAVCQAFFRRYPNPYATHVLSEDTLYRKVSGTSLFSTRIFRKRATVSLPSWAQKLVKNPQVLILEESVVDLGTKRLVSLTRNIDHKKLVVATETIEYIPSRDDPDKTLMTRRTSIRSPLDGLTGRMIERVCHARAIRNVKRKVQGFLYVLAQQNGKPPGKPGIAIG